MVAKIKNREYSIKSTHSTNGGWITIQLQSKRGLTKLTSFNLKEFESVEKYLISKFEAKIIN